MKHAKVRRPPVLKKSPPSRRRKRRPRPRAVRTIRTIQWAVRQLPRGTRPSFLRLWEECATEDVYDGNLTRYCEAIRATLRHYREHVELVQRRINEAVYVLNANAHFKDDRRGL